MTLLVSSEYLDIYTLFFYLLVHYNPAYSLFLVQHYVKIGILCNLVSPTVSEHNVTVVQIQIPGL